MTKTDLLLCKDIDFLLELSDDEKPSCG